MFGLHTLFSGPDKPPPATAAPAATPFRAAPAVLPGGDFVDAGPAVGLLRVNRTACKRLWGLRADPATHPTAASLLFLGAVGSVVAQEPFRSPRIRLRRDRTVPDGSGRFIVVHVRRGDSCEFYLERRSPYQLIYWEARSDRGALSAASFLAPLGHILGCL